MRTLFSICLTGLFALVALSCAYYNIYWMAQQEYEKACLTSKVTEFWNPYALPRVSPESARLLDSSIKRCSKLLVLYPSSKWADDALLMLGNSFLLKGEYEKALKKYQELATLSQDPLLIDQAKYMIGFALAAMGQSSDAIAELEKVVDSGKGETRQKALLAKGIIGLEKGNLDQAIADLSGYLDNSPKASRVREASLYLGRALLRANRPEDAIGVLSRIGNPSDDLGSIASILVSNALLRNGDKDAAARMLTEVSLKAPDDTTRARAMLVLSSIQIDQADYQTALAFLASADSLMKGKGGDLKCQILYEMGNVYERHLGDLAKASEFYEKAARDKSNCSRIAGKRAMALKALKEYESKLNDSTLTAVDVRASTLFRIGEIYFEDLGLTDNAAKYYSQVADSFSDTEFAARALLQLANIAESRQDTMALIYYRQIVERFPQSVYANVARWRLNLPLIDIPFATWEGAVGSGITEPKSLRPPSPAIESRDTIPTQRLIEVPGRPLDELTPHTQPEFEETTFYRSPDEIKEERRREEDYWDDQ